MNRKDTTEKPEVRAAETISATQTTAKTAAPAAVSKTASAPEKTWKNAAAYSISKETFRAELDELLEIGFHTDFESAPVDTLYKAIATLIKKQLKRRRFEFEKARRKTEKTKADTKKIY